MRLAFTFPYPFRMMTGIGSVVQTLTVFLQERQNGVMWIVPDSLDKPFHDPPEGTLVKEVRVARFAHGRDLVLAVGTFRFLLGRRHSIDIIHAHQPHLQTIAAIFFALLTCMPVVVTFHGVLPRPKKRAARAILQWCERTVFAYANEVVLVSAESAKRLGTKRGTVIHNGVQIGDEYRNPETRTRIRAEWRCDNQVVLLFAGRFSRLKGVNDLVRAFASLVSEGRDLVLVLIGGGLAAEESETRGLIRNTGLEERARIYGATRGYREYLHGADLYVFPSYVEGLPLTLLEAMADGLPIVASDAGGIPEAVRDGVEARLVRPGDAEQLRQAIAWMLDHPRDRMRMSENAWKRVHEAFTDQQMCAKYMALYESLLNSQVIP